MSKQIRRNSSFELLRIILILMIMVEHCNMWYIGSGYQSDVEHIAKCIVASVCIGAVNTFVLISGWFGINSGIKKIGKLIFAILFVTLPAILIALAFGIISLNSLVSLDAIYQYVFGGNEYWFVVAYMGLILISPMLNIIIKTISEKQYIKMLLSVYCLIIVYDFVFKADVLGIEGGYSVGWFAFLYLLSAYMRRYGLPIISKYPYALLICSIAIQSILLYKGYIGLRYTNPFILIESICLIEIFSRYHFQNKIVNYIAGGCLMAYLLHMQPILIIYIIHYLRAEYISLGYWLYMAEAIVLSMLVMFVAVIVHKIQAALYNRIIG